MVKGRMLKGLMAPRDILNNTTMLVVTCVVLLLSTVLHREMTM